jgi:hypothetical protein
MFSQSAPTIHFLGYRSQQWLDQYTVTRCFLVTNLTLKSWAASIFTPLPFEVQIANTTADAIYRGWTGLLREEVYLYDVQVSTCLVDAYEDYICFGEVSFFVV